MLIYALVYTSHLAGPSLILPATLRPRHADESVAINPPSVDLDGGSGRSGRGDLEAKLHP